MALHGEGEPAPTPEARVAQALTIELFTQWQTYRNGVHMDRDTFNSIDFQALATAAVGAWESGDADARYGVVTLLTPEVGPGRE